MKILERDGNLVVCGVTDLDLAQTLDCGQCFRWEELPDGSFFGVALNRPCYLAMEGDELTFYNCTREEYDAYWEPYFDLGTDYTAVKEALCLDPVLKKAIDFAPGIRVLRQDSWEALCTFILSQNNNIKRIKGIVARLCETFGEPLAGGCYAFPTPQRLAALEPEDLAPLRCGFRARYVIDAARRVADGRVDLESLKTLPLQEAEESLMQILGVGIKVADCALLYGCGRTDCVPVDVWIRRAMEELFPGGLPDCARPYAGLSQQYLFHYVRLCPDALPQHLAQDSTGKKAHKPHRKEKEL